MAVTIIKQGTEDNAYRWEYYCDAPADMSNINSDNITLGSYCMVLNGTDGIDTYIADSNKNWILVHPTVNKQITAEDEGKIVVNGNFVSQAARPNTIISNDTYDTTQYNSVTVNVQPPLQSKTIITNGTVTPDSNYYGFSEVIVDVPIDSENLTLVSKTITENGVYDPVDDNAHGYNNIIVAIPSPTIKTKFMEQGQVSNLSNYMTANFSNDVDLTFYNLLQFELYRETTKVGEIFMSIPTSFPISFQITGDIIYTLQLTSNSIALTHYPGAWANCYIDAIGYNLPD